MCKVFSPTLYGDFFFIPTSCNSRSFNTSQDYIYASRDSSDLYLVTCPTVQIFKNMSMHYFQSQSQQDYSRTYDAHKFGRTIYPSCSTEKIGQPYGAHLGSPMINPNPSHSMGFLSPKSDTLKICVALSCSWKNTLGNSQFQDLQVCL